MADNTQLNAGTGGDLIRDIAKTVNSGAKTQGMLLDIGGGTDASPELFLIAGQAVKAASIPVTLASDQGALSVSGTFYQATQPISAAALPLPAGAALEAGGNLATIATAQGAGATGVAQPTGGAGVLGWLSGIYNKLLGLLSVQVTTAYTPGVASGSFTTDATPSTSASILSANAGIQSFHLSNLGTATIYINNAGGAASETAGIPVAAGQTVWFDCKVSNAQFNAFSTVASVPYFMVVG